MLFVHDPNVDKEREKRTQKKEKGEKERKKAVQKAGKK
jgi:hypothetical protein